MERSTQPTLILGGGFTGLFTALHLGHQGYSHPTVLIDQKDRFTFKPLLYELLSGEMSTDQVHPRYEELLTGSNVTFVQDAIQAIDLHQQYVTLQSGLHYSYNQLVLALGSAIGYFGIEGVQEYALLFRTGEDAIALGRHLRECLQQASQIEDDSHRHQLLTIGIVGAGPAGVELAATLADILPIWYSSLGGDGQEIQVVLMNRSHEILQGDINTHLRDTAQQSLSQRTVPVKLLLGAEVRSLKSNLIEFKYNGQTIELQASTIIWTTGSAVHPLIQTLPIPQLHRDRHGRVKVSETLQLPDFPQTFAAGDCAVYVQSTGYGFTPHQMLSQPAPATAQVAYQQGATIAHNLKALSQGHNLVPAHVKLRGSLLKLGLGNSAANIFDRFEVTGRLGHLIRQGTYLELLPAPVHNFKASVEWLTDQVFYHYGRQHGSVSE